MSARAWIDPPDGTRDDRTFRFASPVFLPEEYLPIFEQAGFEGQIEAAPEPMVRFVLRPVFRALRSGP